ncbi:DUF4157 domain-containing protein [Roseofilum sp. BLCC_M154]|uniref:DUF4157 domain-containing protein n=1 Tax=Roseofilum acuticapitatum BLCC-M154 TaxID=3022444 RepID=A0ABT7ASW0_9CYAN|nr:DUF4157 domain-containing protein [Roseofilum acuticapitatum]MDJ1169975.1 DUF4157 domain-containing protein [Roseofilum acuticapitatum BLCC-M154]
MARGQMRIRKRSVVSPQSKGKKGRALQAKFNAIQREDHPHTAMGQDAPLLQCGNILQRIIERDAQPTVVQRDTQEHQPQPVNLYPTGKGEPLPHKIVDNFTQQGHPEVSKAEVHVDDTAAKSIGAQAYTTQKNHIVVQSKVAKDPQVLTHEATHVVQQHNMDVQPTIPNTPINDTLEKDAQDNEKRISQNQPVSVQLKGQNNNSSGSPMIQRRVTASTFPEFLQNQKDLQNRADNLGNEHYTTVGFEHEFAQMEDGPLQGLTHVEVGESNERMPYTGINFKLETDAADALEFVSPPFFVETLGPGSTIPIAEDVQKINRMITTQLQGAVASGSTIGDFAKTMKSSSKLNFGLKRRPSINAENKSADNKRNFFSMKERRWWRFSLKKGKRGFRDVIPEIPIKPSSKNGGISAQANIALGGKDIGEITALMTSPESSPIDKAAAFGKIQVAIQNKLLETAGESPSPEMVIFIRQLARTLSGIFSVPSQSKQLAAKGKRTKMFTREARQYWRGYGDSSDTASDKDKKYSQKFQDARHASSFVKDVQEIWVKDTIMNFGLGILQPSDWARVLEILDDDSVRQMLSSIEQDSGLMADMKEHYPEAFKKDRGIGAKMIAALDQIATDINSNNLIEKEDVSGLYLGPDQQPDFLSHDPKYIGVRQDTYLPGSKVRLPGSDTRTHVLETRRNIDDFIDKIDKLNTTKDPLAPLDPIPITDRPEHDKAQLRKRYPIGSFIRYRVANQVNKRGNNHDIDCLAKVVGYGHNDQGTQYQIAVKGMRFVESKTFRLVSNDFYDYSDSNFAVYADDFNVEEQGRTHFKMNFIQQGEVLTS